MIFRLWRMAALIWLICMVATCTLRIVSSQVSGQLTPETTVLEASSVAVSPTPTYLFEGYAFCTTLNVIYMYMHYTVFSTVWLCIMYCCHMPPFCISVVRPQVWVQPLACNLVAAHLQLWYRTQLNQPWPSLLLTFQTCLLVSGYRSYMMWSWSKRVGVGFSFKCYFNI